MVYLVYVPFFYIAAPLGIFIIIGLDILAKILTRIEFGWIERYNLKLSWWGPILGYIITLTPPLMDVGTIQCIQKGEINVIPHSIRQFTSDGVIFENGTQEKFDGIVMATGFEVLTSHGSFLDPALYQLVGYGKEAEKGKIWPGSESKVKGLWFLYGRLQNIRDLAPSMAKKIKKRLGYPVKSSWIWNVIYLQIFYLIVAIYYYFFY